MSENTIILSTDDTTASVLVKTIRAEVNGVGKYAAYVEAHGVTRENVADHARALAVLAYPNDEPVQAKRVDGKPVRTRFGTAVSKAGTGLRAALDTEEGKNTTKNLLTSEGKKATREAVLAEWEAAQK